MKQRAILLIFVLLAVVGVVLSIAFSPAIASSHREAPFVTEHPKVDGTDFYMFRSYEEGRDGFVTLIANYLPLQDAYGGPNYFTLDPEARYRINIENDGDLNEANEDIVFEFQFFNILNNGTLPVGDEVVEHPLRTISPLQIGDVPNVEESYTVSVIRGGGAPQFATNGTTGGIFFAKALDYFGEKTFADYEAYAQSHITPIQIPGCDDGRVFVGQRKEPFAVNLGESFDLVNITNPLGNPDAERSDTADKNITSLILEVVIDCVIGDGPPVIGGWTTALLPRTRTFVDNPTFGEPDQQSGAFVQVSRLGNPLVNELVIGLRDKNLFNAAHPRDDGLNFAQYVTNPTLPVLLETLFPGTLFAPTNIPRNDLVKTFLAGFPGLNEDGSVGEIMRLNTATPPTPPDEQSNLGVAGGDLAGFPNGRRPGDDVVDITLRVAMGALCHVPDPNAGPGGDDEYTATLLGSNVVPPVNTTRTGNCLGGLFGGNQLEMICNHNVPNVIRGSLRKGAAGEEGDEICRDAFGPTPVLFGCALDPDEVEALSDGEFYIELNTISNPNGEVRGQIIPPMTPTLGMCDPGDAPWACATPATRPRDWRL